MKLSRIAVPAASILLVVIWIVWYSKRQARRNGLENWPLPTTQWIEIK